jgi:ATP/maltotriose-dependent transcriptional regulator MalT
VTKLQSYFPRMAAALGAAYILDERVTDAMPLLMQAQAQSVATERAHFEMLCSLPLGEAHMLAGRLEEAHTLAERALALAHDYQERGHAAYALRLLGEIAGALACCMLRLVSGSRPALRCRRLSRCTRRWI